MRFLYCLFAGSGRDGYSVVARDLLEHLAGAGHEVDTVMLADRRPAPTSTESGRRMAALSRRSFTYRHPLLRGSVRHWAYRLLSRLGPRRTGDRHFCPPGFLRAVRAFLETSDYDAAIAATAVFSRIAGMARCPTVVDIHELFTHKAKVLSRHGVTGSISPYLGLGEELDALRPFDLVWCPSRRSRRIIERALPGARCFDRHISYRAIVPDGYAPPPVRPGGPGRLLFAGSTSPENRPGLLSFVSDVLPRIRAAVPACELHVAGWEEGDLPAGADLRNAVFHGILETREEVLDLFAAADVVVIPRFLGGLTVKGVEALCLGKAAVGHEAAFSGCYEIESWKQAVIVRSPEEFAGAVIRLLREPALRASISEEAWRFSRWRFSPERAYEDLHAELASLRRDRGARDARGARRARAAAAAM